MLEQQPDVVGESGTRRGHQLFVDHLTRRRVHLGKKPVPRSTVAGPEPELEQQREPAIV